MIADTAATKDFSSGDGVYLAHYLPKQVSFAALRADGSVVAWGAPASGGDLQSVAHLLINVRELHASSGAFVAVTEDGKLVSWGRTDCGGDSSKVQGKLLE